MRLVPVRPNGANSGRPASPYLYVRLALVSRSATRSTPLLPTYVIPPGLHEGTLQSWNVAFQRQLPYGFTADIAYVGSRGVDSWRTSTPTPA